MATKKTGTPTAERSVASLVKAGLELGVAEAARKVSEAAPKVGSALKSAAGTSLLVGGTVTAQMGKILRDDPDSVVRMVKEVWSRGGPEEKKAAAGAVGRAVGKTIPHQAVGLARELARMARNNNEADWVGQLGLAPILEANPALTDRVRLFIKDNEPYVRRAATAALLQLVQRRKSNAVMAAEAFLWIAESKEKEIRTMARKALKQLAEISPSGTGRALRDWAVSEPTKARVAYVKGVAKAAPGAAKQTMEKLINAGLAKIKSDEGTNGTGNAD